MYGQNAIGPNPPCSETSALSLTPSSDQVDQFLYSPVETLLESMAEDISVHDVIEAYNLFSNRIQANIQLMANHDLALPVLQRHSSAIADALYRDIKSLFHKPSSPEEEDTHNAPQTVLLCHEALRLLSNIFTFPALFRCFNNSTLSRLLNLVISTSGLGPSEPPPLCQPKTILLVVWLLKMQRLPVEVLVSNREAVALVLRRCIQGDAGKNQVLINGLQAASSVIQHHSNQFLESLSDIIPHLLNNLFSEVPEIRVYSINGLGAFAMARLQSVEMTVTLRRIADQVVNMIESSRQRLVKLLSDAMSIAGSTQLGFGPIPALCLTAALMILCDTGLLTHSRVLMTLIAPLEKSLVHKSSSVRSLHPHVWNCLVWSFGRLNATNTRGNSKLLGKAFDFVKQELRQGIATAIVSLFLPSIPLAPSGASEDAIARVFQVLQDMSKHKNQSVKRNGVELLSKLLAGSPDPASLQVDDEPWSDARFLPRQLFDGTLLRTGADKVSAAIRTLLPPDIDSVRSLTDQEVEADWHTLQKLWNDAVRNMLAESDRDSSSGLLHAWQTLLLTQAEFTQEHSHFTTDPHLQANIIQTVVELVIDSTSSTKPDTYLTFVKQLIGVVNNVYAISYVKRIAESVLCELLRHSFDLASPEIRLAWNNLCHELLSLGIDRVLEIIGMMVNDVAMKRALWMMIVQIWQDIDANTSWQNIVQALSMPFGVWKLTSSETEGWETALESAVRNAISKGDQAISVVESFIQLIGENNIPTLLQNPSIVLALLSQASQRGPYPACCSRLANESLCHCYTQGTQSSSSSLNLLGLVHKVFLGTPASSISSLLKDMQQGLRLWFIDEQSLLSDDQYNQFIIPIYCSALDSLQRQPSTADTILDFSDFLVSAFVRVPSPALGPKAFRAYWQATFHGRHEFVAIYPDSLKQCLRAFDEAAGGDLGMGLSLETASDMTPTPRSVVSSSQSPYGRAVEMLYDAHYLSQPRFTNTANSPNKAESKMLLSPGSDPIFMEPTSRLSVTSPPCRDPPLDLRQPEYTSQPDCQPSLQSMIAGNPLAADKSGTWLRTKRHGTPIGERGKRRKTEEGFFSSPETPRGSPRLTTPRGQNLPYEEEEDYDKWEIGISNVNDEDEIGLERASSPEPTSVTGTEPVLDIEQELLDSSPRTRRRDRSQTEPQDIPSPDAPRRIPLKRNQTTSARLEALQRAHILVHDDASQVPVEDLEHAAMLVQQIGNALNEQMNKRGKKG